MYHLREILMLAVLSVTVQGQISDDFSNNLASDLGPLLALFGENMTKQYLSESVTVIDYLIFALAPIGIITAIVSVIRVCGTPWLRAFIGRAQEGPGSIEAELCTSTSRDVCELFNNAGITRVLGRPKILELVRLEEPGGKTGSEADMGIHLFHSHLSKSANDGLGEWKRTGKDAWEFPPNPNLTLNVGIKTLPRLATWTIAVFGLVLQTSVIVLVALGAFKFPQLLGIESGSDPAAAQEIAEDRIISQGDAARSFIIGSVLLSAGMFGCAYLIGRHTKEETYTRANISTGQKSRLCWIQPGNQVIGDQTFDSFGYVEGSSNKIKRYISSRKEKERMSTKYLTYLAIVFSLGGYVAQFVGLRGLGPWVAIAQLSATLIMSFIRGLLKRRDLTKEHNKIVHNPDLIAGHELDWLAFRFARDDFSNNDNSAKPNSRSSSSIDESWHLSTATVTVDKDGQSERNKFGLKEAQMIFEYRCRLAHLTGHFRGEPPQESEYRPWDGDHVAVRIKAMQLSKALCRAVNILTRRQRPSEFRVVFQAVKITDKHRHVSDIMILFKPRDESPTGWSMDSSGLEAILGLWLWSSKMLSEDRPARQTVYEAPWQASPVGRIVATDHSNLTKGASSAAAVYLLWLGHKAGSIETSTLMYSTGHTCSHLDLWVYEPSNNTWKYSYTPNGSGKRFVGWNNASTPQKPQTKAASASLAPETVLPSEKLGDHSETTSTEDEKMNISYVSIARADSKDAHVRLLDELCRELFSSTVSALAPECELGQITTTATFGEVRLRNETITALVEAFTNPDHNLGTEADAFYCILPSFQEHLKDCYGPALVPSLKTAANDYRLRGQYGEAESLLQMAVAICEPPETGPFLEIAFKDTLVNLLELYRVSIAAKDTERRAFGYRGLRKLVGKMWPAADDWSAYGRLRKRSLVCYVVLAEHIATRKKEISLFRLDDTYHDFDWDEEFRRVDGPVPERNKIRREYPNLQPRMVRFLRLVKAKNHTGCLIGLCLMNHAELKALNKTPALPWAAANGWKEVVEALLEAGVSIDSLDDAEKTSLMHFALQGDCNMVESLLLRGAKAYSEDMDKKSALFYASQEGHEEVVKRLLDTGVNDPNGNMKVNMTPITAAAKGNHVKTVQVLLDDSRVDPLETNNGNLDALTAALLYGHSEIVAQILRHSDMTVSAAMLPIAAILGHTNVVRALLDDEEQRVDINATLKSNDGKSVSFPPWYRDSEHTQELRNAIAGRTALSWAAHLGHLEVVNVLLSHPNCKSLKADCEGRTPLLYATSGRHTAIIERLLAADSRGLAMYDMHGITPLSCACSAGHADVVKLLLQSGGVLKMPRVVDWGMTSMLVNSWWACCCRGMSGGSSKAMKPLLDKLIESGIEPSSADYNLCQEVIQDHEIASLMIKAGNTSRTFLSCAVVNGHVEATRLILEALLAGDRQLDHTLAFSEINLAFRLAMTRYVQRSDILDLLLNTGKVDVNRETLFYPRRYLVHAVCSNRVDIVRRLVKNPDLDVNHKKKRNPHTPSALALAVHCESPDMVEALLDHADCDINDRELFSVSAFDFYLRGRQNPGEATRFIFGTPLEAAIETGNALIAMLLLTRPNVTTTYFAKQLRVGELSTVQACINYDHNGQDREGFVHIPALRAAEESRFELSRALVAHYEKSTTFLENLPTALDFARWRELADQDITPPLFISWRRQIVLSALFEQDVKQLLERDSRRDKYKEGTDILSDVIYIDSAERAFLVASYRKDKTVATEILYYLLTYGAKTWNERQLRIEAYFRDSNMWLDQREIRGWFREEVMTAVDEILPLCLQAEMDEKDEEDEEDKENGDTEPSLAQIMQSAMWISAL